MHYHHDGYLFNRLPCDIFLTRRSSFVCDYENKEYTGKAGALVNCLNDEIYKFTDNYATRIIP